MNNESAAFEESALKALQDILHNRIMQKKGEIHQSHSEAYTGSLSREIETLHWVLAQSLSIRRRLVGAHDGNGTITSRVIERVRQQ
jgi:hypothetical protein